MAGLRETRFSDVCGTVDELKRMLNEGPEARTPEVLVGFVQDCIHMLERMELRLGEFQRFRDEAAGLVERMQMIGDSRRSDGIQFAGAMMRRFTEGRALSAEEVAGLSEQAEEVRSVAGEMEQLLRRSKEVAMEVGRLYREVEGGRGWDREGREAEAAGMEERLAAWLPPSPHREQILDYLKKGRAHLLPAEGPPLVQFEDGGVIALSAVRYSEAVSNFVPASFDPSPRAQLYRGRKQKH
ncbi:MAG: hypothetical protein EXS64_01200 [Candidatus Latescibacteria bacterium]|nr:hypothetical protein [Candidatus Latescibacterota bacterium]